MFDRVNKHTISQLLNQSPLPCEEGIEAALKWIGDDDLEVTAALLLNAPSTVDVSWAVVNLPLPSSVLIRLYSKGGGWFPNLAIANPACPEGLRLFASKSERSSLRQGVAIHSKSPDALLRLAMDEDIFVRTYVAGNKHAPEAALDFLSKDKDPWIRYQKCLWRQNCKKK